MSKVPELPSRNREDTVPCGLCGVATFMTSTKRCDSCWEIETRIRARPLLAAKILASLASSETKRNEEVEQLRAFAARIFDMVEWPECLGEVDGGNFQSAAIDAGLLRAEVRHEPCGDGDVNPCQCMDYHGVEDSIWKSGVTCYRKAPYLVAGGERPE